MEYYERLMNEALQGSKNSLKELKSNAGAGSAEAQYHLALYYAKGDKGRQNPDYQYWMEKAIKNGYVVSKSECINMSQERNDNLGEISFGDAPKEVWRVFRILARIISFFQ